MPTISELYSRFPVLSTLNYSSELAEVLLSDEDNTEYLEKPSPKSKAHSWNWHWVFHAVNSLIILCLIAVILGIDSAKRLTYLECWERSHTYCKPFHSLMSTGIDRFCTKLNPKFG